MRLDQVLVVALGVTTNISTLVLVALGLSVIFGMMRVINLAHGELIMLGAYTVLTVTRSTGNIWVGMVAAPIVVGAVGLVVERLVIRFLYGRILDTMLATWGLSLVLVQAVTILFGPTTQGLATPLGNFSIGAYSASWYSLFLIAMAGVLLAFTYVVFKHTPYGLEARAATQLPGMASAMGVNAARSHMITFAFGASLAGAAGALIAPIAGVVPTIGLAFIARAFMTVIVGGPAILLGTTAAAAVLGICENLVSYLATPFLGQGALLTVAIVILRVLPSGLSAGWRRGA
jgi:urea ABC transporter permease protein UrtB